MSHREFYIRRIREDTAYAEKLHNMLDACDSSDETYNLTRMIERCERAITKWRTCLEECEMFGIR